MRLTRARGSLDSDSSSDSRSEAEDAKIESNNPDQLDRQECVSMGQDYAKNDKFLERLKAEQKKNFQLTLETPSKESTQQWEMRTESHSLQKKNEKVNPLNLKSGAFCKKKTQEITIKPTHKNGQRSYCEIDEDELNCYQVECNDTIQDFMTQKSDKVSLFSHATEFSNDSSQKTNAKERAKNVIRNMRKKGVIKRMIETLKDINTIAQVNMPIQLNEEFYSWQKEVTPKGMNLIRGHTAEGLVFLNKETIHLVLQRETYTLNSRMEEKANMKELDNQLPKIEEESPQITQRNKTEYKSDVASTPKKKTLSSKESLEQEEMEIVSQKVLSLKINSVDAEQSIAPIQEGLSKLNNTSMSLVKSIKDGHECEKNSQLLKLIGKEVIKDHMSNAIIEDKAFINKDAQKSIVSHIPEEHAYKLRPRALYQSDIECITERVGQIFQVPPVMEYVMEFTIFSKFLKEHDTRSACYTAICILLTKQRGIDDVQNSVENLSIGEFTLFKKSKYFKLADDYQRIVGDVLKDRMANPSEFYIAKKGILDNDQRKIYEDINWRFGKILSSDAAKIFIQGKEISMDVYDLVLNSLRDEGKMIPLRERLEKLGFLEEDVTFIAEILSSRIKATRELNGCDSNIHPDARIMAFEFANNKVKGGSDCMQQAMKITFRFILSEIFKNDMTKFDEKPIKRSILNLERINLRFVKIS